jgi:hypothetical protein
VEQQQREEGRQQVVWSEMVESCGADPALASCVCARVCVRAFEGTTLMPGINSIPLILFSARLRKWVTPAWRDDIFLITRAKSAEQFSQQRSCRGGLLSFFPAVARRATSFVTQPFAPQ